MKEAEIQIGCTYRVTNPIESRIFTIKNKAELIASLHLNDQGRIEPIVLDADELVRLWFKKQKSKNDLWFIAFQGRFHYISKANDMWAYIQLNRLNQFDLIHVHQTQQLFQALTGENLPYNEK